MSLKIVTKWLVAASILFLALSCNDVLTGPAQTGSLGSRAISVGSSPSTWYMLDAGGTPSGLNLAQAKGSQTGFQPTRAITTTPLVWYTPTLTGSWGAGSAKLTLWTSSPGAATVVKAEVLKTNSTGGSVVVLGSAQLDVNASGTGNHTSVFNVSMAAVSFNNDLLAVRITKVSGGNATAAFNSNDFNSNLVVTPGTTTSPTPTPSVAPSSAPGWNLVWSDEFNGSGQPDAANWNYEVGNGYNPGLPGFQGWGNGEWEWYRPENTYQQGGNLVIRADYSTTPIYTVGGRNWYQTSGRITTHGKQSFQYGRIEARMKLPTANGNWAAFWAMGTSTTGATYTSNYHPAADYYDTMANNWASNGEIDIMEHVNGGNIGINNTFWDIRTGLFPWTAGQIANYGNTNVNFGDVSQYHTYAIEWDAQYIKWFCDGVQTHIIDVTPATLEEFRKPFYLILNLAIGGSLPGVDPNIANFPLYMYVDYVRFYKKS